MTNPWEEEEGYDFCVKCGVTRDSAEFYNESICVMCRIEELYDQVQGMRKCMYEATKCLKTAMGLLS